MFAWLLRAKAKHTSPRAAARGRSLTCREARRKKTLQKLNIHHKKKDSVWEGGKSVYYFWVKKKNLKRKKKEWGIWQGEPSLLFPSL